MCFWSSLGFYFGLTLLIFILNLFFVTSIPRPSPLANNIWRLRVLTPYNFYHLITRLWSNYVHKGGKVWKCKCWKRKDKTRVANCKLYQMSPNFGLHIYTITLFFHLPPNPFYLFFYDICELFFSLPTKPLMFAFFWVINYELLVSFIWVFQVL